MGKPSQKLNLIDWNEEPALETSVTPRFQSAQVVQPKAQAPRKSAAPERAMRVLKRRMGRGRVPEITQMSQTECGLACLAMVLSYHGRHTSINELRAQSGLGRDGLSALSIVKIARNYNLRVRAISLQNSNFSNLPLPAIIHWEFNHFVVVERWSPKGVHIVDPAQGRRYLSPKEFDQSFTGVAITLEPGVQFDREAASPKLSLRDSTFQYLKQTPTAMLEVLGTSLLILGFGLVLPLLTKFVLDEVLPLKLNSLMGLLGAGLVLLVITQTAASLLREWLLIHLPARIVMPRMLDFFERMLTLPYKFFQVRSSGDLLARMASNTVIRDTLSNQLIGTFLDGSTILIYFVILFLQSSAFALLALALGALQIIVLLTSNKAIHDLSHRELTAQGKSQGYMAEALAGMATLKAAGAEQQALEQWTNLVIEQLNISVRRNYLTVLIIGAQWTFGSLSPLALLWLGAAQVMSGSMSTGTMFALNALASAFLGPLSSLVGSAQQLQVVRAHFERLADVSTAEPEQDRTKALPPPYLSGRIDLEHVSFAYDSESPKVLYDISLHIEAGQKVALVGRTGSGKSTLGKLLLGLYMPSEGQILYDNFPLANMDYQDVRRQFGVVMQDTVLFSGSVRQNIALHDPAMPMAKIVRG